MARGEIAGFGGVGNRKAPASSGGGRRPSFLVRHSGLACLGAGRESGAGLPWVSREDAKTRRGRRGGQRGSRRDRRGTERRRGAGAGAGAEGPYLPSPCPRLKAGAGIGAGGGGGATIGAYATVTARSAARPTGRRALWRESQAGRTARARRLRAPTNRLAEGRGLRPSPLFVTPGLPAPAEAGDPGPGYLGFQAKTRRGQRGSGRDRRGKGDAEGPNLPSLCGRGWGRERSHNARVIPAEPLTPASKSALPLAKASARRAPSIAWNSGQIRTRPSSARSQKVTREGGVRLARFLKQLANGHVATETGA